jgi:beta-galactosidase
MRRSFSKKLMFTMVLAMLSTLSFAQITGSMLKTNFDTGWRFHLGNAADPSKDFNFRIANIFSKTGKAENTAIDQKFSDTAWATVKLPHDWAVALPFVHNDNEDIVAHGSKPIGGLYPENSIGWYRKHFTVAKDDSGKHIVIKFDGVYRDCKVWVNGFYLGTHESGYTGFSYDLTDYLNYGKDNVVVVRADATQPEGWFYEGAGIYRHVWLLYQEPVHIVPDGIFIYTNIQKGHTDVHTETTIENQSNETSNAILSITINDRSGNMVKRFEDTHITLAPHEQKTVKTMLFIKSPHLWSVDDPYLYRAVFKLSTGVAHNTAETTRFGIRSVQLSSTLGLLLNGEPVKIKGVNCHQDHAGLGTALPDYLQYYRIRLLKDMGANAYRTSHYPPTPELLDACDSLGMLVLDENRLLNTSPEYMQQWEDLIRRDRSRACVFLWSIGNEEGYVQTTPTGKKIAQQLIAKQAALDPTRVCTYAADLGNTFQGINEVIPVRGFNYREYTVEAYHKDHPLQPIVGTEMGSTVTTRGAYSVDSIKGYVPDQDITAPWWASTAEAWWKIAAQHSWWAGGFVWTGFDYRGEPTPYNWPDINANFGLMDVCGFPKNIYYYYQSWWTDKDVLHISPHWNWKGREGQPINVWINTNADNAELLLNGKSLGKKDMPRNGHLQWQVNYEPGVLQAVAYKNGRRLSTRIETTDTAAEIVLTPSKTTMIADGSDAAIINVSVIDKAGREVPDAANMIHFTVKGNANIIGVGNGNPSSHEKDKCDDGHWKRRLFNGKCQLILQAGYTAGNIDLEATGKGLYKNSTTIITIHPGEPHPVKTVRTEHTPQIKPLGKIIGADVSFLPELEAKGEKFTDAGVQKDALEILKDHGFNYIRLRVFNNPSRDSGYSPGKGFCDLPHTLQMAKRIKALHMKLLLDFHYSDYWADPQQQYMPAAWRNKTFPGLQKAVYNYTYQTIMALKDQGLLPDMVQIGNEINHGIIWPDGQINNLDSLARLIYAGISAVKDAAPGTKIMLHIALGGQNDESRFFLDNMIARNIPFDVIGLSYYPKWHGTLDNLRDNLLDLSSRYGKEMVVVEYSQFKQAVNDIIFNLPGNQGKGAFIWEPLSTWEAVFDENGKANSLLNVYDSIKKQYNVN